jgi:hypothetical protein
MADRHVVTRNWRPRRWCWFKRLYNTEVWRENPLESDRAHVEWTDTFSEAYVFDSFEEAYKVFNCPSVRNFGTSTLQIRYYSDKEYFKEILSRG